MVVSPLSVTSLPAKDYADNMLEWSSGLWWCSNLTIAYPSPFLSSVPGIGVIPSVKAEVLKGSCIGARGLKDIQVGCPES